MMAVVSPARLKRNNRKIMAIEEMPNWLVDLLTNGRMDVRHDHLDSARAPEGFDDSTASIS